MNSTDKTIEEIAARWNVSPRYVQYLCKQGKIEGAIKRAGVWFVPDDTPIPIKNNKSNTAHYEFVGTKKNVFNNAILLYMRHGFENVTMRDVAEATGIRQSAMYNHFSSKQQILSTIYDYYCYCHLQGRPTDSDIEQILQTGTLQDIVRCSHYKFHSEYAENLLYITKILFQRVPIDERAREIIKNHVVEEGLRYVENIFQQAVAIGRLAPMDTRSMAVFINSVRIFTLHNWIVDDSPENMSRIVEEEMKLYDYASQLIVDLKPR